MAEALFVNRRRTLGISIVIATARLTGPVVDRGFGLGQNPLSMRVTGLCRLAGADNGAEAGESAGSATAAERAAGRKAVRQELHLLWKLFSEQVHSIGIYGDVEWMCQRCGIGNHGKRISLCRVVSELERV